MMEVATEARQRFPSPPWATVRSTRDFEQLVISFAVSQFRRLGWRCHELAGARACAVQAEFVDEESGEREVCAATITAQRGTVTLETILLPSPAPQGLGLREALNALNLWSSGSLFLLRECGVVARQWLLPRPAEAGGLATEGLTQALRRLSWDRRRALPVLEGVLRRGTADLSAVRAAFAVRPAGEEEPRSTLEQLLRWARTLGYRAVRDGASLRLDRADAPAQGGLRASVDGGVLRVWTLLGEDLEALAASSSSRLPELVVLDAGASAPGALEALLSEMNALNEASTVVRYVWSGDKVCALASSVWGEDAAPLGLRQALESVAHCARKVPPLPDGMRKVMGELSPAAGGR